MIQSSIAPLSNILSGATKTAVQSIQKLQGPAQILPSNSISNFFSNLFKSVPKVAIPTGVKSGTGSLSRNIAITGGTLLGTTAISSYFLSTPAGQNTLDTANNFANLGGDITGFLSKNPIVPIGLLILGGLIVVSVIKK